MHCGHTNKFSKLLVVFNSKFDVPAINEFAKAGVYTMISVKVGGGPDSRRKDSEWEVRVKVFLNMRETHEGKTNM